MWVYFFLLCKIWLNITFVFTAVCICSIVYILFTVTVNSRSYCNTIGCFMIHSWVELNKENELLWRHVLLHPQMWSWTIFTVLVLINFCCCWYSWIIDGYTFTHNKSSSTECSLSVFTPQNSFISLHVLCVTVGVNGRKRARVCAWLCVCMHAWNIHLIISLLCSLSVNLLQCFSVMSLHVLHITLLVVFVSMLSNVKW